MEQRRMLAGDVAFAAAGGLWQLKERRARGRSGARRSNFTALRARATQSVAYTQSA
jgi:hypothetical protein